MRKSTLVIGVMGLLAVSATVTFYAVESRTRRTNTPPIQVGRQEEVKLLSPLQLLEKGSDHPASADDISSTARTVASAKAPRREVMYPDWHVGTTRLAEQQPLTDKGDYVAPTWSPVGLDVAFTKSDYSGVYVAAAADSPPRLLTEDILPNSPVVWNPDGMSLRLKESDGQSVDFMLTGERYPENERQAKVYEFDDEILLRATDGEDPRPLSGGQDRFYAPVLSPDETKVVFMGRETGIHIARIDSDKVICVGPGANPTWLPDSSGIVYDVPVSDGVSILESDLWYASADGTERTNLTNTPGLRESYPSVASDGDRVAYSNGGAIYVARLIRAPQQ